MYVHNGYSPFQFGLDRSSNVLHLCYLKGAFMAYMDVVTGTFMEVGYVLFCSSLHLNTGLLQPLKYAA